MDTDVGRPQTRQDARVLEHFETYHIPEVNGITKVSTYYCLHCYTFVQIRGQSGYNLQHHLRHCHGTTQPQHQDV